MSDDKDLMWEEISTEHIVQDEWIDFRKTAFIVLPMISIYIIHNTFEKIIYCH